MAERVYRVGKIQRSFFRKLPFNQAYWAGGVNPSGAPVVKSGRRKTMAGMSTTTGVPTYTAVADTRIAVIKVPHQFLHRE